MKTCKFCGRLYTQREVDEMLLAMGFGVGQNPIDEDYLVVIYGLCPECWPDFDY